MEKRHFLLPLKLQSHNKKLVLVCISLNDYFSFCILCFVINNLITVVLQSLNGINKMHKWHVCQE